MRTLNLLLLLLLLAGSATADPLPSWRAGETRTAILAWVADISDPAHADFIPRTDRIAVLDNDGTSWCERPGYGATDFQIALARDRAASGQLDAEAMPFKAWFADDRSALRAYGYDRAYSELNAVFAGMSFTAYRDSARAWLGRSPHPRFGVPLTDLYYTGMLELKDLLLVHGFQVWIVTGAEQDFVRSFSQDVVGIPPGQVIGTWTQAIYRETDGVGEVVRSDRQNPNGYRNKPAAIETRIGKRPVLAAGNSNNDQAMMQWALTGRYRGLALWIRHDDAEREYDYDRGTDRIEKLVKENPDACEVSMKRDWLRVFAGDRP
jgi:hypothetical protein